MPKLFKVFLIGLFTLFVHHAEAQDKLLTFEDITYQNPSLFPARVSQLQWLGDGDYYTYAKENAIYKVGAKRGTESLLFDLDMMNAAMHNQGFDSLKRLPALKFFSENTCSFNLKGSYYHYDYQISQIKAVNKLPEDAAHIETTRETKLAAYTIDNNVFLSKEGTQIQVTHDQDKGIVNGQTVHRNEFGIQKGLYWSPSGQQLAFYRKDETMVADYPLVNISKRIAEVETTKYPMAGMTSEQVTLGVYNLELDTTVFIKTGEPKDQYLTSVTWGPEGKYLYVALLNRDQNHLKLNQYDSQSGDLIKTLFEESHPKYVEPENPLYFLPNNHTQFIWMSEADGYNHMYLYNTDGHLIKQLTHGPWVVTDFMGFFGKDKNELFFKATEAGPLEQNIYLLELGKGSMERVSRDHGTHSALVSSNGKYIIDIYANIETSRAYKLLNQKGETIKIIQEDQQPLKEYALGEMKMLDLKADDGSLLKARMILPVPFDETKKYPAIVYVYGGPHAQLITDSWLGGAGLFLNYLAQQGYVVFTLDNRGSAQRGRAFEQAIFRNAGTIEVADQMVGVNYLKSLPFVDGSRIGVDGWSYGGFMCISMLLKNPGVFKVGVAGGPVIDWQYYEVMYGERYMDTPQDNPEGYKNASLLNYVDQLDSKLLIIHGTMDPVVVWQHSLLFLQEAVARDKLVDYLVYPGHEHNVRGKDRAHLYKKIVNYFKENL